MGFNNVRNVLCKPIAGQYFFFGMIVGATLGLLLMAPLNKITIETSFFKLNMSNPDDFRGTETPLEGYNHLKVNTSVADDLYNKVKILCWIMTGPKNHETKARHVKNTWGKRCNILIFMSTKADSSLPSVALPVIEDRANLWGKTKEAFKYVYEHYYDQADWFFKADDDTYAIMENMRYMLRDKNTMDPVYYGYRFKPLVKQGYMSGGAGYVLGKEALRRFINESLPYPKKCKEANTGSEDAELGRCLEAVNVTPADTRDTLGKTRFVPVFISPILSEGTEALGDNHWLWSYNYYPLKRGMECCSDYIISVHYVDARTLYLLDFFIYHVKRFGLSYETKSDLGDDNFNKRVISVNKENSSKIETKSVTDKYEASWNNLN